MYLLYDILRCLSNCFKPLRIFYIVFHLLYFISVFFEIFKKTNSILRLKLFIQLFIFHMLDQMLNQIMKTLTQYFIFQKKLVGAKTPNHVMGLGLHPGRLAMSEERKWLLKGFPIELSQAKGIWRTVRGGMPPRT